VFQKEEEALTKRLAGFASQERRRRRDHLAEVVFFITEEPVGQSHRGVDAKTMPGPVVRRQFQRGAGRIMIDLISNGLASSAQSGADKSRSTERSAMARSPAGHDALTILSRPPWRAGESRAGARIEQDQLRRFAESMRRGGRPRARAAFDARSMVSASDVSPN